MAAQKQVYTINLSVEIDKRMIIRNKCMIIGHIADTNLILQKWRDIRR